MQKSKTLKNRLTGRATSLGINNLNKLNLPKSMLIIPDGNRRWARAHHLEPSKGHWAGGDTVVKLLDIFIDLNIKVIGIWGLSEDNWKREKQEIDNIMEVVGDVTNKCLEIMKKKGIKFIVLGQKERIKTEYPKLYEILQNAQAETANNTNKTFAIFLDYGERFQLEEFARARLENPTATSYELLSNINNGLPLFDMVLRTSGEQRLSGFGPLASIAEFVTVKKNLPEVDAKDIVVALKEFSGRKRRLGGN